MRECEIIYCHEEAEYRDPMGNLVCEEHMEADVEDGTYEYDDFEIL